MRWICCFSISVVIFLFTIAAAFVPGIFKRIKASLPTTLILFIGVFSAISVCIWPAYFEINSGNGLIAFRALIFGIIQTIQVFTVNSNAEYIIQIVESASVPAQSAYSLYLTLLSLLAPILTAGILINFIIGIFSYLRYAINYSKDIFAFSEINENSICLAKDIHSNRKNAVILFADTNTDTDDFLLNECKSIKALVFKKGIESINFSFHKQSAQLNLFLIGEESNRNVLSALHLIDKFKAKDNTSVYVLNADSSGELLLSSADKGKIKLRRVNEIRSCVYRFLYDDGKILFENAKDNKNGTKIITAVIVGMNAFSDEMFRALCWFCQMDGYLLKLHVFDSNPDAEDIMKARTPELFSDAINGKYLDGESSYNISVHSGVTYNSASFNEIIGDIGNMTFAFVNLDNDNLNIDISVNLRILSERLSYSADIVTVIRNPYISHAVSKAVNYKKQNYNIRAIGSSEQLFSQQIILETELESLALERHKKYGGKEDEFWGFEYNYRSSIALVIANKARQFCNLPFINVDENKLTTEQRNALEILEHKRWNAYMRSEGYVYSGSTDKYTRNDLAKMHHDLVPFEKLSEAEKRKDGKVSTK